ncbi:MAG: hypothetical protein K8R90_08955 [Candidatus Cloacimonetes bacterium]|nr:hypothetical protein [Candidatus Cloacimonadota bacterium]
MNWKKFLPAALLIFSVMAALLIVACDDRAGDPVTHSIARMEVNPDTIYADNNITFSTVWVYVKDNNGFPVPGQRVSFKSSLGTIEAYKDTDSSGVAEALFWDSNQEGVSEIFAFVGGDSETAQVTIKQAPEIGEINMTVGSNILIVDTAMQITATVITEHGLPVDDGTQVVFDCDRGYFTLLEGGDLGTRQMATTSNGIAKVYYNSGTQKGEATIKATLGAHDAERLVDIIPGTGISINMTVPTEPINVGEETTVTATVKDRFNNTIREQATVTFTADLGDIPASAATDTSGTATVSFSSGVEAGLATVTAACDSASANAAIVIASDEVSRIQFPPDAIEIDQQGTGGVESAPLQVYLLDMSGNMITDDMTVWFTFALTPPDEAHIDGVVYAPGDSVGVPVFNGLATASINSGTVSGPITVEAYTYNEAGERISSTKGNIVIKAGLPEDIELGIGEYDTGTAYGSGLWQVGISAYVTDSNSNAVTNGTAVFFELMNPELDSVTVNASGYTGNISVDGDSLPGVAFSYVIYDGSHSNDIITVRATSMGCSVIAELKLPMNQPTLDCDPIPQHVDWVPPDTSDKIAEVHCIVRDSEGNYLHDAIIQCNATRGIFINPDPEFQTDMGPDFIKTNYDGLAIARILFQMYECPGAIPPPGETPVDLTFILYGTEITDNCTIIMLNYH